MKDDTELFPPRSIIPNAVTAANILAGFMAMTLAAKGRFDEAVYLLLVAIFLDTLDGQLARLLKATSTFGQQLDSFSDTISFGVAPAFLIHQAILHRWGAVGIAISMLYILAGVYRLARFNLLSDAHTKGKRTLGVPIPIGAGHLMVVVLMRDELPPLASSAVVVLMAALMASRWSLPEVKGLGLVTGMLFVGLINFISAIIWPNWYIIAWWCFWNALIVMATRREDRQWRLSDGLSDGLSDDAPALEQELP